MSPFDVDMKAALKPTRGEGHLRRRDLRRARISRRRLSGDFRGALRWAHGIRASLLLHFLERLPDGEAEALEALWRLDALLIGDSQGRTTILHAQGKRSLQPVVDALAAVYDYGGRSFSKLPPMTETERRTVRRLPVDEREKRAHAALRVVIGTGEATP